MKLKQIMKPFFLAYPKVNALRSELSRTRYCLLLRIGSPNARGSYDAEAENFRWSTCELQRQINAMLFERLALSRDRKGVQIEAAVRHTLPEQNKQIFASRCKLCLLTEEALAAEKVREHTTIEMEKRLFGSLDHEPG
jgi:hypothetical protein